MPAPNSALASPAAVDSGGRRLAVLVAENAVSVHDPTDIALCGFITRSMLMNRSGRPRSAVRSAADTGPPAAAIQRASRASVPFVPVHCATLAMIAAPPAAPPTKKYIGTSHVHTGGFSSGTS